MAMADEPPSRGNGQRNGKLRIPLPFEEALKAATEAKPPKEPKKAPRKKQPQK